MANNINKRKPVYVVSDNIISSLGFTTEENIQSILQLKTGITIPRPVCHTALDAETPEKPCSNYQGNASLGFALPATTRHFPAARLDYKQLNLQIQKYKLTDYNLTEATAILSIIFALQSTQIDIQGDNSLLILSTTKGNIAGLSGTIPPEKDTYLGYTVRRIANYFKMKRKPTVISNACVSGVTALQTACRLLETGTMENIVVSGIDFVTPFTVSGFESLKAISEEPCKPFDAKRNGLSIGEGAATIVLTNKRNNFSGEKEIVLLGGATSNDANHISGPSRTGEGLYLAIENALNYANVDRSEIDFINLHGTATVFNDDMESKALRLSRLSGVPVNGLKGYYGHTLGASGVIETVVCIESLRNQTIYATLGLESPGTSEPMNIVNTHRKTELHTVMKTASGFGGVNSVIILSDQSKRLSLSGQSRKQSRATPVFSQNTYTIRNNQIKRNETLLFETTPELPFQKFIRHAYSNLKIDFVKFYKMDNYCKLGFLAVEYLLKDFPDFDTFDKNKRALVFCTSTSSLDTDLKHRQSISETDGYFPSPAVFVYTLPNILSGEIAIKNKIQGETICFVNENPDFERLKTYLQLLFDTTDTELAIFWKIDFLPGEYEVSLSYVKRN